MTRATRMSSKVDRYLQLRRALGYQLRTEGMLLQQFGKFADSTGHRGPLTTELALRWAQLPKGCDRLYSARRLEIVGCFARHLTATEPGTEVPGRRLLGPAHRRTTPYIYTDKELAALLIAARRLSPSHGLRPQTYMTLFGLLACTGLRISEALHLTQADVDLEKGVLKVRMTKFRKSRLVPVHWSAIVPLRAYSKARDLLVDGAQCDRFFMSDRGQALPYSTVRNVFRNLCNSLGITDGRQRRPRLHDIRHNAASRFMPTLPFRLTRRSANLSGSSAPDAA